MTKRDFAFLGKFLFVGLVLLIVASLANLFFQIPALSVTISAVAVLIFSLYLLHDLSNIVRGGETNYVMATLNLFLNVYNIFISLLNLLLAFIGAARLTGTRAPHSGHRGDASRPVFLRRAVAQRVEQRDRLDVRRVREHVDHARRREIVAVLVHEHRRRRARASPDCTRRRRSAAGAGSSRGAAP